MGGPRRYCNAGHPLTDANTYWAGTKRPRRNCMTCRRKRLLRYAVGLYYADPNYGTAPAPAVAEMYEDFTEAVREFAGKGTPVGPASPE